MHCGVAMVWLSALDEEDDRIEEGMEVGAALELFYRYNYLVP